MVKVKKTKGRLLTPSSAKKKSVTAKKGSLNKTRETTSGPKAKAKQSKPKAKQTITRPPQNSSGAKADTSSLQTSFREKTVTSKQLKRWKLLQQPTKTFVQSLIDNCIEKVINLTPSAPQVDVGETLTELKQRILQKLNTTTAPSNKHGSYQNIQADVVWLKKQCAALNSQVEELEEAIDSENKLADSTREQLRKLKLSNDDMNIRKTLSFDTPSGSAYPDHDCVELIQ